MDGSWDGTSSSLLGGMRLGVEHASTHWPTHWPTLGLDPYNLQPSQQEQQQHSHSDPASQSHVMGGVRAVRGEAMAGAVDHSWSALLADSPWDAPESSSWQPGLPSQVRRGLLPSHLHPHAHTHPHGQYEQWQGDIGSCSTLPDGAMHTAMHAAGAGGSSLLVAAAAACGSAAAASAAAAVSARNQRGLHGGEDMLSRMELQATMRQLLQVRARAGQGMAAGWAGRGAARAGHGVLENGIGKWVGRNVCTLTSYDIMSWGLINELDLQVEGLEPNCK